MPITKEKAKQWLNPFQEFAGEDNNGFIIYLYRSLAGRLDKPWAELTPEEIADPLAEKNHVSVVDWATGFLLYLVEAFCRGHWLHKVVREENLPRAKMILQAVTFPIWVTLNIVRGLLGAAITAASLVVGLLIASVVVPIVKFVRWIASGSSANAQTEELLQPPERETMQSYDNPYGIPYSAPRSFWESEKSQKSKKQEEGREVTGAPQYQQADGSVDQTLPTYDLYKPAEYEPKPQSPSL